MSFTPLAAPAETDSIVNAAAGVRKIIFLKKEGAWRQSRGIGCPGFHLDIALISIFFIPINGLFSLWQWSDLFAAEAKAA
jgi:hypothetical protein